MKVVVFTIQVAEIKMKMQVDGINLSILNISITMILSVTLRDVLTQSRSFLMKAKLALDHPLQ